MLQVFLVLHVFIVISLVIVVLLQRSEGGALGMGGGGGGGGGFMTSRGAANALTRATTILAALFFVSSLGLTVFGDKGIDPAELNRTLTGQETPVLGEEQTSGSVTSKDLLQGFGTDDQAEGAEVDLTPTDEPQSPSDAGDEADGDTSENENPADNEADTPQ